MAGMPAANQAMSLHLEVTIIMLKGVCLHSSSMAFGKK